MTPTLLETAFAILRLSLDAESKCSVEQRLHQRPLSKEDWREIYQFAQKQTVVGVMLVGVHKLSEELLPPDEILDDWTSHAFYIRQANEKMNDMCAKVTKMFVDRGLHPVILKGQANARLYPDPYSRQCGDIDVFVEGGKKSVIRHLTEMGLMEGISTNCFHHVHLESKFFDGISVEVHFNPVNCMPIGPGKRLLQFLFKKAEWENCLLTPEGFYVPSIDFALMMQMSHIRRHFMGEGIGLRHFVDYFLLLKACNQGILEKSRKNVKKYSLKTTSKALMWSLNRIFGLDETLRLSDLDEKWGKVFVQNMLAYGNFGKYNHEKSKIHLERWKQTRKRNIEMLKFDFLEAVWTEFSYWKVYMSFMPERIRQRKLSLQE